MKNNKREQKLLEHAERQGGYFTAKQAHRSGYSYRLHTYHVKTGRWIKASRGIFRLRSYPVPERDDLIRWSLWSRNRKDEPQMVVSHETALAFHEMSDVMPAKLHFTVPPRFRKKVLKNCVIHRAVLKEKEIEKHQGFSVTNPYRTLKDVAEGALPEDELVKALRDALDRGLVQLKRMDINQMTERAKLRILMAIKTVGDGQP
jgi:predicted transcriptional regulator of viral defense system